MNRGFKTSALFHVAMSVTFGVVLFATGYFAQSETTAYWMVGCAAVFMFLLYSWLAPRFGQSYKFTILLFLLAGVFAFTYAVAAFREVNELGFEPQEIAVNEIEKYIEQTPLYVKITGILRNDLTLHWTIKSFTPDASGASTKHEGYEHKCLTPFTGQGWKPEVSVQIITDVCRPPWKKQQSPELKTIQGYLIPINTDLPLTAWPYTYPQSEVNPLPTVDTDPMQFKLDGQTLMLMGKRRPENLVTLGVLLLGIWFFALLLTLLLKVNASERKSN